MATFAGYNTQVLGISVDHIDCLRAWAESLGGITYPLLSDFWPHGAVAQLYGVFRPEGFSERAIFVLDRNGVLRYIDIHDIADQPDNEVLFQVLRKLEPGAVIPQAPQAEAELPHGGIVMYCTSWCPGCRRARLWLQARNLPYTEVDIDANPAAAAQVRKWADGNRTTPTFDIDGTIVINFDERKVLEALKDRLGG